MFPLASSLYTCCTFCEIYIFILKEISFVCSHTLNYSIKDGLMRSHEFSGLYGIISYNPLPSFQTCSYHTDDVMRDYRKKSRILWPKVVAVRMNACNFEKCRWCTWNRTYTFFSILPFCCLRKLPFFDLMHLGDHFFLLAALRRMTFNFFPVWFERFFPCQTISIDIIQTCIVLCLVKWCKMHQNCTSTMSNIGSSIKAVVLSSEKALPILKIEKKSTCFWTGW